MKDIRPATIFCDIDGTLISHLNPADSMKGKEGEILPYVEEKIKEWERKGYNIILVTGRKECLRKQTEETLAKNGILYDQLIMGLGGGKRYLINDLKPVGQNQEEYAIAINIDRDTGLKNINI